MKPKDLGYPPEIWTQILFAEHIRENCIKEEHPDLSKINQGTIWVFFISRQNGTLALFRPR